MGYLANFMVYTLAMIGVISIALLIFKNSASFGGGCKSKHLKVLDTLTIAPRKTLYVISTGREKFLIAGDVGKTALISKLESAKDEMVIPDIPKSNLDLSENTAKMTFQETMANLPKSKYMDKSNIGINSSMLTNRRETPYTSVIRSLASKMR